MAIIRKPWHTMIQEDYGATHHYPVFGDYGFNDEIIANDPDRLNIQLKKGYGTDRRTLFPGSPKQYIGTRDNEEVTLEGLSALSSDYATSGWTLLNFMLGGSNPYEIYKFTIGGTEYSLGAAGSTPASYALVFDPDAGEFRAYKNAILQETVPGAAGDINDLMHLVYRDRGTPKHVYGHFVVFDNPLVADDLQILDTQRRFLGKISGTATVDGAGAAARIRALPRGGDFIASSTTANADGTYELWVTDPDEMDILAIPPDGVAARPLAHGPITPIDQN